VIVATGCWHDVGSLSAPVGRGPAYGINTRGDVVGYSPASSGSVHAVIRNIRDGGHMVDITPHLALGENSSARSINELGMVAGSIYRDGTSTPFFWWPLAEPQLNVLPVPPGMVEAEGIDVDEKGNVLVVGSTGYPHHASFIWNPGAQTYTPVPPAMPGGFVVGHRFDDHGGVVGWAGTRNDNGSTSESAAVWDPGTLAVHVLPKTTTDVSWAWDRNAGGMIVGFQERADGSSVAVYWPSPTAQPVELPGTVASAVNNAGQIVGYRTNPADGKSLAVMWEPGRPRTTDLGDKPGGSVPFDVNEAGETAGWSMDAEGNYTPVWWDAPAP
jgi:uncharacterized membrane protein